MDSTPVVYLLVPLGLSYGREVIRGVREYTQAHRLWQLAVVEPTVKAIHSLRRDKPDGIIGLFAKPEIEREARALRVPAVNTSCRCKSNRLPIVLPDNVAIGRLVAEHFLQRGYRHFAYAGFRDHYSSELRRRAFAEVVAQAGYECHCLPDGQDLRSVRAVPSPIGLMACNDTRATQIIAACQRAKVRVPEDIAVVGVDNDEALCETADVPISSVDPDCRRVGYEAAATLDRLMSGQSLPEKTVVVPPIGLVVRASSDSLAVPDDQVANAMRYMQAHACDPMRVEDMMGVVQVSRRTLEKRFRTIFGRTLHDEIRRLQFERARQLLCDTDMRIPQVATRCGFKDPKRFTTLFREEFGSPPIEFRRDARQTAG